MFHYMVESAKDRYRQFADAAIKGPRANTSSGHGPPMFQYGDWFDKYPHGVSRTHWEDPDTNTKKETGDDAVMGQRPNLQSVEDFFASLSPSTKTTQPRKQQKRNGKRGSKYSPSQASLLPRQTSDFGQQVPPQQQLMDLSMANSPTVMAPGTDFPGFEGPVLYQPSPARSFDQSAFDYGFTSDHIPQLDRHFVYGAYAGTDPSTFASGGMPVPTNGALGQVVNSANMWTDPFAPAGTGEFSQPSAWFLPFNLDPLNAEMGGDPTGQMQNLGMPDLTGSGNMMNTFDMGLTGLGTQSRAQS
jgi:hypothetical protein